MADLNVLGIMSGTSLDGVDFVKIKINKNLKCRYIDRQFFKFSGNLKNSLMLTAQNKKTTYEVAELHFELGRFYAECFRQLKSSLKKIDLIGLHGQTVYHRGGQASYQIGEASFLSEVSGRPVVSNFRAGDIAVGGQGAPLAPLFHEIIFGQKNKSISIHNLGGISNLTLIVNQKVEMAFDTGPANMLIDDEVRRHSRGQSQFDANGKIAKSGRVDEKLVLKMLKHEFFYLKPPKSCGREEFGEKFRNKFTKELSRLSYQDRVATLTELTIRSIEESYLRFCRKLPAEILFCGGGAQNKYLLDELEKVLVFAKVSTTADVGWPSEAIEGAAFAVLAALRYWNIKVNLHKITGARKKVLLGQITQV